VRNRIGTVWASCDDAAIARLASVKDEVLSAAVGDGSPCFRDEESPRGNIPFIFRFPGDDSLDTAGCGECEYPRDGADRPLIDRWIQGGEAADLLFPLIQGDDRVSTVPRSWWSNRFVIEPQTSTTSCGEQFVRGRIEDACYDRLTLFNEADGNAKLRFTTDERFRPVYRIHHPDSSFLKSVQTIRRFL
jgi:hypothetical protein